MNLNVRGFPEPFLRRLFAKNRQKRSEKRLSHSHENFFHKKVPLRQREVAYR